MMSCAACQPGYSFEHGHYNTLRFTVKSQSRANLIRYLAIFVPLSVSGKNCSRIAKLSFEE
jgi:hypothetical protein